MRVVEPQSNPPVDTRPVEEIAAELQRDLGIPDWQARRMAKRARGEFAGGVYEIDDPSQSLFPDIRSRGSG
jgi:hypothetical protein